MAACQPDQVFSADGSTSVNGTATDLAGNRNSGFVLVRADKTPPTLNPVVTPNPILLNGTATATANATDVLSGVATQSCGPVITTSVGPHTVTCSATDNAGNTNTVTVPYVVNYNFSGYLSPIGNPAVVNTGKAGKTYPIKWQLTDVSGTFI